MSTIRKSGDVRIRITYREGSCDYRATITAPGMDHPTIVVVGEPNILRVAVDSPTAFDEVAKAALSFAMADAVGDDVDLDPLLERDEDGEIIIRRVTKGDKKMRALATLFMMLLFMGGITGCIHLEEWRFAQARADIASLYVKCLELSTTGRANCNEVRVAYWRGR